MRKIYLYLGVWLLLLMSQQGAVLHELNHMQVDSVAAHIHGGDGLAEKTCGLCLAYSQLASPVARSVCLPVFSPVSSATDRYTACPTVPTNVPTPRSRGPPAPDLKA